MSVVLLFTHSTKVTKAAKATTTLHVMFHRFRDCHLLFVYVSTNDRSLHIQIALNGTTELDKQFMTEAHGMGGENRRTSVYVMALVRCQVINQWIALHTHSSCGQRGACRVIRR